MELAGVLGLVALSPQEQETASDSLSDAEVEELIAQRQAARQAKNYVEGDRLRDLLQAQGITLIDAPGGETKWHRG